MGSAGGAAGAGRVRRGGPAARAALGAAGVPEPAGRQRPGARASCAAAAVVRAAGAQPPAHRLAGAPRLRLRPRAARGGGAGAAAPPRPDRAAHAGSAARCAVPVAVGRPRSPGPPGHRPARGRGRAGRFGAGGALPRLQHRRRPAEPLPGGGGAQAADLRRLRSARPAGGAGGAVRELDGEHALPLSEFGSVGGGRPRRPPARHRGGHFRRRTRWGAAAGVALGCGDPLVRAGRQWPVVASAADPAAAQRKRRTRSPGRRCARQRRSRPRVQERPGRRERPRWTHVVRSRRHRCPGRGGRARTIRRGARFRRHINRIAALGR